MHVEVAVVLWIHHSELLLGLPVHPLAELVEHVEVPLLRVLGDHAGLLQQEVGDLPAHREAGGELDLDVLALGEKRKISMSCI